MNIARYVYVLFWIGQPGEGEDTGEEHLERIFDDTDTGREAMHGYVGNAAAHAKFSHTGVDSVNDHGRRFSTIEWSYDDDPTRPFFRARLTPVYA